MVFRFISSDTNKLQSADNIRLESLDFGGMFPADDKTLSFCIGNDDDVVREYGVVASGLNGEIINDVQFSLDNLNYFDSVISSGINPGQVSSPVSCKYTPEVGSVTASGTFLIHVDEFYAGQSTA